MRFDDTKEYHTKPAFYSTMNVNEDYLNSTFRPRQPLNYQHHRQDPGRQNIVTGSYERIDREPSKPLDWHEREAQQPPYQGTGREPLRYDEQPPDSQLSASLQATSHVQGSSQS